MSMTSAPRTQHFVSVDILTTSYRVVGKTMVTSSGVVGMINNMTTAFMEVHDARLARIHMPTKLADHFEVVRLSKKRVFVVCLNRREDIGPQSLARGGYATVAQHPIRVTTQSYEIEGTIEWQGRFDFKVLMSEGTRHFLPLYDAKVTGILIPTLKIESPAVLFNREQVDMLGLLSQRTKKEN
ncbi:MAG: hypothetical protein B5M51_02530 [Anaerolinea sp. 4484_236]|nr:MAG: hypothetical protein B5M51_02530 [Anaerolinea sp. 4484_236]